MLPKLLGGSTVLVAAAALSDTASADSVYVAQPVTASDYNGDKTNSVSCSGQIARYALHDSRKKLAGKGTCE